MTVVITAQMALEARDQLLWIATHWPHLRAALQPGGGNALTGMPRHAAEHPAPINVHIADLMHEIEQETETLALTLLAETDDWQPRDPSMPALLAQVATRYGHWTAADHHTALAFINWAEDYTHRVRRALEPGEPPRHIGPCPIPMCDGELHLKAGRTSTTCPLCGHEQAWEDQKEWIGEQFEDRLMTPAEIVSALAVLDTPKHRSVVYGWIKKGHLVEAVDGLYRISDARELATRGRGRPKGVSA